MKRGFTLVELLVVIVIIGVMASMIGPTFTSGSDAVRVKTATRGVMQMSRYARTMALLHQMPLDLVFSSAGGVSVSPVGASGGGGLVSSAAFGVTNAAVAAEEKEAANDAAAAAPAEDKKGGGGSSYVMADLEIEKKYEQVTFTFDGFTDSLSEGRSKREEVANVQQEESPNADEANGEPVQSFRVRYKSNGTCRPYRVKVAAGGDSSYSVTVVIDMLGIAKVEEDE